MRVERAWRAAEPDPGPLPPTSVAVTRVRGGQGRGGHRRRRADGPRRRSPAGPASRRHLGRRVGRHPRAGRRAHPRRRSVESRRSCPTIAIKSSCRLRSRPSSTRAASCAPTRARRAATGSARSSTRLRADARILVGNRSTVYAPAARLGLIAIWDDGDPLQGEPLAPGRASPRRGPHPPGAIGGGAAHRGSHAQRRGAAARRDRVGARGARGPTRAPEGDPDRAAGRCPSRAPPGSRRRPGARRSRRSPPDRCWCRWRDRATRRCWCAIAAVNLRDATPAVARSAFAMPARRRGACSAARAPARGAARPATGRSCAR